MNHNYEQTIPFKSLVPTIFSEIQNYFTYFKLHTSINNAFISTFEWQIHTQRTRWVEKL